MREGTAAAKRSDHVAEEVKNERYRVLSEIDNRLHQQFLESQVGTTAEILVEKRKSPDYVNGYTRNYTPVRIYGSDAERHSMIKVMITGVQDGYCTGKEIQYAGD